MIRGNVPEQPLQRPHFRKIFVLLSCHRLLLAALLLSVHAWPHAQQDAAEAASSEADDAAALSLFVFTETQPQADAQLSLNGTSVGRTQASGRLATSIAPGVYELEVRLPGQAPWVREFQFTENELVQILVNFFADQAPPFVDIETSNPDKLTATAAQNIDVDAEPGTLSGRITSSEDGQGIAGVRVFVSGVADEQLTDEEGRYAFMLPPGEYALSVLAARFNTRTLENIPVSSNETTTQDLKLSPAGSELPEYVVVEPFVAGSLASIMDDRRATESVSDFLGAEQISRAGDGDVASALRRVTGLTLVGGKFIFIRGLGERYSATYLNRADVPSPDPTRRVVPLDLFPTSIVEVIEVQKGYTYDQPPDFGGGAVQIKTRSIPESNFVRLEIDGEYNSLTTFKDGLRSEGSSTDIFGFDNGARALPDALDEATAEGRIFRFNPFTGEGFTDAEIEAFGESLPVNYDVLPQTIEPGFSFGLSGGLRFDFDGWSLGGQAAVDLSNDWQTTSQIRRNFAAAGEGELAPRDDLIFDITQREVSLTGYTSVGAELGEHHKIGINAMLLRSTTDENEIQTGTTFEFDTITRVTEIEFEERELQAFQFNGEHMFPGLNGSTFNWQYTLSDASSDIPDFRSYRFEFDPATDLFIFASRADGNLRNFTELDDSSDSLNLDVGFNIGDMAGDYHGTLKVGYQNVQKDRESDTRRFRFAIRGPIAQDADLRRRPSLEQIITPATIDPDGFVLDDITQASDFYTADLANEALYFGADITLFGWLRLNGGVRKDDFEQEVITFDPFDPTGTPVASIIDTDDLLPTIGATVTLPWDSELRLSYAESVNRPQFRELTPADFIDPILDRLAVGNPDLLPASIQHFDFRLDKYFSETDFISTSVFHKTFDDPIEALIQPGANQLISFGNADTADLTGIEFEFYKTFGFFGGFWQDVFVSTNFAWITSSVTLDEVAASIQTNDVRALQGQSPYVMNAQLGYAGVDDGLNLTILYNSAGKRIAQVGTLGRPDIFEQKFHQLDFVARYNNNGFTYRFSVKNLLNDEVKFTQGDEITRLFEVGREVSLGLQYQWD